jgi:hypothetical protein
MASKLAIGADLRTEEHHVGVGPEHVDLLVDDAVTSWLVYVGHKLGEGIGHIFAGIGRRVVTNKPSDVASIDLFVVGFCLADKIRSPEATYELVAKRVRPRASFPESMGSAFFLRNLLVELLRS